MSVLLSRRVVVAGERSQIIQYEVHCRKSLQSVHDTYRRGSNESGPIMPAMRDDKGASAPSRALDGAPQAPASGTPAPSACGEDPVPCERCGRAGMYRMHAVWRCPACGFKTDCCGW